MKKAIAGTLLILFGLMIAGCKQSEKNMKAIPSSVQSAENTSDTDLVPQPGSYVEEIFNYMRIADDLEIEACAYFGKSTEGGEITRYRHGDGTIARYKIVLYGEMGCSEHNYYFEGDSVYYTKLAEYYTRPIYMSTIDIWYRSLEQGLITDGQYYQYDNTNQKFVPASAETVLFLSLEELNEEFTNAKEEEANIFSSYNIVSINGNLLGGYYDGQWLDIDTLYPQIQEKENYKIYIDGKYWSVAPGYKVNSSELHEGSGTWLNFDESIFNYNGYNQVIAFSGWRSLMIDCGTYLPVENEFYQNALQEYLAKAGLQGDFEMQHLIKADLDNDGQDEILIHAFQFADTNHESQGVNYMRKVIDGEVRDIPIPLAKPITNADYITFCGFCDLNGDGIKELLLSTSGVGDTSYMAYEYRNSEFVRVLESGTSN